MEAFINFRGVCLIPDLDDWLLTSLSPGSADTQTEGLLSLSRDLGLMVNTEKSDLVPSQSFQFMGITFNLPVVSAL